MQWMTFLFPVLYAVFLWWFTTGLVIAAYGRTQWITRVCFAGATTALLIAFFGLWITRDSSSSLAIYAAITCGVLIWGWQVAAYYLNFITGPSGNADPTAPQSLADRFRLALHFSIYHELMALGTGVAIAALTWSQTNRWGLWIYLALWIMHASAKINVFLGVRNFHIEYLPGHLHHFKYLLGKRSNNEFFPVSIVISSSVALALWYQAIVGGISPEATIGYLFVATMITLGILEHWLLVLPLPGMLWGWGIRPLQDQPQPKEKHTRSLKSVPQPVTDQLIKGYRDDD